jgi:Mg2+ and Co2+ transporter CorA
MLLKKKDYDELVKMLVQLAKRVEDLEKKIKEQPKEKESGRPFAELKKDWMLFDDEKKGSGA